MKKIDIAHMMQTGENTISFDCDFVQSPEFYENRRKSFVFESEKNKLCYDMEIESIYLVGDFALATDDRWTALSKKAVRYEGSFVIDAPRPRVTPKNLEQQGYPFFCGELVLEGELDILGDNPVLELDFKGVNAVRVELNGITKVMLTDNRLPLADFGVTGKVPVKFTLINNLRNLLGPHHLAEGECYTVGPASFFREPCVWNDNCPVPWHDGYCFVEFGI